MFCASSLRGVSTGALSTLVLTLASHAQEALPAADVGAAAPPLRAPEEAAPGPTRQSDAKAQPAKIVGTYHPSEHWSLSAAMRYASNPYHQYDYHPFEQQTFFAELRYDY